MPFEQLGSERPLSIARHLQLKPADPRGEAGGPVRHACSFRCWNLSDRRSAPTGWHQGDRSSPLVESGSGSAPARRPCPGPRGAALGSSRQKSQVSKVAIASRSGLVRLVAFPNLTERDGFFYSACSVTQSSVHKLVLLFRGFYREYHFSLMRASPVRVVGQD
jgi:hypothetical protein